MAEWNFRIPGEPVPWTAQIRNAERSPSFLRMQTWQDEIRAYLGSVWMREDALVLGRQQKPLYGPVAIDTTFYRGWPERAPQRLKRAKEKWRAAHIIMAPDADNYRKAFLDALEPTRFFPGVILNDAQVIGGQLWKNYTYESWGFTEMTLKELE